jgi:hypothetical protein
LALKFSLAPDKDIHGPLEEYFRLGCSNVDITELLKEHYDVMTHGLRFHVIPTLFGHAKILSKIISLYYVYRWPNLGTWVWKAGVSSYISKQTIN